MSRVVEVNAVPPMGFQDALSLDNVYNGLRGSNQSPLNQLYPWFSQ